MSSTATWPEVLGSLIGGVDLTSDQTAWAMGEVLSGQATDAQIAGFAVALRAKGETIDEMEGLVQAMYAAATPLVVEGRVLDVVGTGGDRSFSVNISTMAAIVAAGAGVTVVKHGNRSASSKAGSADVLEKLASASTSPPRRWRASRARPGSPSASRRRSTQRCVTRPAPGATWESGRASTSSVRSPTRPDPARRPSAVPTAGWRRSWPGCSPAEVSTRGCSAGTTVSTS